MAKRNRSFRLATALRRVGEAEAALAPLREDLLATRAAVRAARRPLYRRDSSGHEVFVRELNHPPSEAAHRAAQERLREPVRRAYRAHTALLTVCEEIGVDRVNGRYGDRLADLERQRVAARKAHKPTPLDIDAVFDRR